jgi:tRNA threonylcarbamoyladenosine biosynthesis protein TsaB
MTILALDTTTRAGSVAVVRGDTVLALVHGDATRTHGERLPGEVEQALRQAGVAPNALDLVVVASGPGAFTGLRIGLAAIQGLAMVLAVPAVGVSALEALAEAAKDAHRSTTRAIVPWMDAQRGEVFAAIYACPAAGASWTLAADPVVGRPREILARGPRQLLTEAIFIGDGASRYRADIAEYSAGGAVIMDAPGALAAYVARLGREHAGRGEAGPPHALQPVYVRRSDAERQRDHTA